MQQICLKMPPKMWKYSHLQAALVTFVRWMPSLYCFKSDLFRVATMLAHCLLIKSRKWWGHDVTDLTEHSESAREQIKVINNSNMEA